MDYKTKYGGITVTRSEDPDLGSSAIKTADEYLWQAWRHYNKVWIWGRKRRVRLTRDLAYQFLEELRMNMTYSNWICLSRSENKRRPVRQHFSDAMSTLWSVTNIEYTEGNIRRVRIEKEVKI